MKVVDLLIFFSIFIFCISSGCINENLKEEAPHPLITNVDVMSIPADEEFGLKVTVYMQNPMDRDTGSLSIKVKTKDQYTNLITAEHTESVGYLKVKSQSYKTLFFNVPTSGEQLVMVELFEDNNLVDQQSTYVQLIEEAVKPVPNVILTDLLIETIQATNYGKDIIFEASPGLYNQGDEANKVTVVVTAVADEYTRYTGSAIASNLEQNQRTRSTVRMTVPADRSYSFEVNVIVDSEITASGETSTSIKLNDIKLKTPTTYALIESGSPVSYDEAIDEIPVEDSAEYAAPSPGFEAIMFAISMLCTIGILRKKKREI